MALNEPFYKKYGAETPDFGDMIKGQQAMSGSITDAVKGVKDLLNQTEEIYKQNNTLNVQEYLQNKVKEQGLRADPVDKIALQRQFGNMLNMDQVESSFKETKQQLELNALDDASTFANQAMEEAGGDALAGRKKLEEILREKYDAPESMISQGLQAWTDANAVSIKDAEIEDLRNDAALSYEFRQGVKEGQDPFISAEALSQRVPEYRRNDVRRMLEQQHEQDSKLTEIQQETVDHHVNSAKIQSQAELATIDREIAGTETALAALQEQGISGSFVDMAKKYNSTLGGSAVGAITEHLDSRFQQLVGGGQGKYFKEFRNTLINKYGIPDEKADAILLQAFNTSYGGDGLIFNSMNKAEIDKALAEATRLAEVETNKLRYMGQLSKDRTRRVTTEGEWLKKINDLKYNLTTAGRQERLGVEGAFNPEEIVDSNINTTGGGRSKTVRALTPELKALFKKSEQEYGLPDGYLERTAGLESSNDPNAKNDKSTATGLFQMIHSTAKQYNVDPRDPRASTIAIAKFTRDNKRILEKSLGREPTGAELYLAQLQGAGGALKLLNNPNANARDLIGADEFNNNGGKPGMTARQYANMWINKFNNTKFVTADTGGDSVANTSTPGRPSLDISMEEIEAEVQREAAERAAGKGTGKGEVVSGKRDIAKENYDNGLRGGFYPNAPTKGGVFGATAEIKQSLFGVPIAKKTEAPRDKSKELTGMAKERLRKHLWDIKKQSPAEQKASLAKLEKDLGTPSAEFLRKQLYGKKG